MTPRTIAAAACGPVAACAAAACASIVASDVRSRRIPNASVAALGLLGVAQACLGEAAGVGGVLARLPGLEERLAWAVAVVAALFLFESAWRRLHAGGHGMGFGDVKLVGAIALWVGPACLACLAAGTLLGAASCALTRRRTFPLGPYLVLSFIAALLFYAALA